MGFLLNGSPETTIFATFGRSLGIAVFRKRQSVLRNLQLINLFELQDFLSDTIHQKQFKALSSVLANFT